MLQTTFLVAKLITSGISFLLSDLYRFVLLRAEYLVYRIIPLKEKKHDGEGGEEVRNIVVVGASFAGYEAARVLAKSLSFIPGGRGRYRVVVVEPHSHFHFTWLLPRFCVVPNHEHKAFIPYGGYLRGAPPEVVRWVAGRAVGATQDAVRISGNGSGSGSGGSDETIPCAFLIVATGSWKPDDDDDDEGNEKNNNSSSSLPSRVDANGKKEGIRQLRDVQRKIRGAENLVVVGAGAAGVELATDAKAQYPDKKVVLVHSRDAVMHRFGPRLQAAAMEGLRQLGVEVITGERFVGHDAESGFVTLKSGRQVECDVLINCAGQRPASDLIAELSPTSISATGQVRVKPTMQIADDALPNVYACGDVAETGAPSPNARSANRQGVIAADNILSAIQGKPPSHKYIPHFMDGGIKLTLGLEKSVGYVRDGDSELLLRIKEKDIALMSRQAWWRFGAKAYEDDINGDSIGSKDPAAYLD